VSTVESTVESTVSSTVALARRDSSRTVVEVHADPRGARASCRTVTGALSARVLGTDSRGAHVALVANRALLLAGDHVEVELVVGPGAWLTVTEITGTVAYDAGGVASSWSVSARVGAGASLLWDAPPFVVATGADVARSTVVELAAGAVAGWREAVVLGRTGEAGGRVRTTTRVTLGDVPVLVDEVVLGAPDADLVTRGTARVVDTTTLVGLRAAPVDGPAEDGPTMLQLAGPGTVARQLTDHVHESALDHLWPAWQEQVRRAHAAAALPSRDQVV
jgi:urease accessory protein